MAGDGHIRKAQQRRCVMKTVEPNSSSSLSHSPILLPSSPVCLISRCFKLPFNSSRSFKLKCFNKGTKYYGRFGFLRNALLSVWFGERRRRRRKHTHTPMVTTETQTHTHTEAGDKDAGSTENSFRTDGRSVRPGSCSRANG